MTADHAPYCPCGECINRKFPGTTARMARLRGRKPDVETVVGVSRSHDHPGSIFFEMACGHTIERKLLPIAGSIPTQPDRCRKRHPTSRTKP